VDPLPHLDESDTSPEQRARLVAHLRALTPSQKWMILGRIVADGRAPARAGLRARHPQAGPREIEIRLAALLYGREAAARLGPVPDDAALPIETLALPDVSVP
jgi:hypothetical protein